MSGWDAVVVGAGPAGAATAMRLASAGHRVLMLDREAFPRPKPCGDCLNPGAVRELASLGALAAVRAVAHAPIAGWSIHPERGRTFGGSFPPADGGIGISRHVLDAILVDLARKRGVEVRTSARVADLLRDGERLVGVRLAGKGSGEAIRARLVIGADGLRSIVVRKLGLLKRRPRLRKLALTAHLSGLEPVAATGELRLHRWGCIGIAPIGGGLTNVTVVVSAPGGSGKIAGRDGYFDQMAGRDPRLRDARREGSVLATGPFDWPTTAATAEAALLVGDAAGYYDPFTGQGIYRALRGASLAADTAATALRNGDLSAAALKPYERARARSFTPAVRLQHVIETFIAQPRLLARLSHRLAHRPEIVDALLSVTGDLEPVRSLLHPRILAALVR